MRMLVGTNTKMNLTPTQAAAYCDALRGVVADVASCEIFVLPPFTSIPTARDRLTGSNIAWGAQTVHALESGAYTGEISAPMLADLGCRYVAVGHSERRRHHGETDDHVADKTAQVLRHGMTPIVCVGESSRSTASEAAEFTARQVATCLRGVSSGQVGRVVIAYEPEWAIGSGAEPAEPDYVDEVHRAVMSVLSEAGAESHEARVIYGGSVDLASAPALLEYPSVAGLFVGRFALDPESFGTVIRLVDRVSRERSREVPATHARDEVAGL